jgi:transcriptional regulator with XRE-family HTH domain
MGDRLREWRRKRLLTQEELAKLAGVGYVTISRIENTGNGRVTTLRKLASALNITPAQLMEGEADNPESKAA